MNFSKETIKKLANLLLIDLNEDETNMVYNEFEIIDKNINKINEIDNIKEIEPMTHPIDNFIVELREDKIENSIPKEDLLSNSDNNDTECVVIPKVV